MIERLNPNSVKGELNGLTLFHLNEWEKSRPSHFHPIVSPEIYHFRYNIGIWSVNLHDLIDGHDKEDLTLKKSLAYVIKKAALRYGIDWSPYSGYRAYIEQSGKRGGEYVSTYHQTESQALLDAWVRYLEPRPL